MGKYGERAEEYFREGYNCAQAVFLAFAPEYGMSEDVAKRIASSFGGGIGGMRSVCGTVSGMCMAAGLIRGYADPKDYEAKKEHYAFVSALAEEFQSENGSIICRELLGLVPLGQSDKAFKEKKAVDRVVDTPVSQERTAEYYKKRPCPKLCGDAAVIFNNWLEAHK